MPDHEVTKANAELSSLHQKIAAARKTLDELEKTIAQRTTAMLAPAVRELARLEKLQAMKTQELETLENMLQSFRSRHGL